jgi:predicted esterase/chitodextrinase
MKRILLLATLGLLWLTTLSQNVFDPNDPQIRYSSSAALGSAQRPNPAILGLQKWVSTPQTGISTGSGAWDNSSYKAYFFNRGGMQVPFRVKFPRSYTNPDSINKVYPVALFFHGAGEFACPSNNGVYNNEKQLVHGARLFRDRVDNNSFDGFLVYPQSVIQSSCWGDWGSPTSSKILAILQFVDSLAKYARADQDRLFLYGLSAGGKIAWNVMQNHPQKVAAVAPSAAVPGTNFTPAQYLHIPIWFASGGKDTNPSPAQASYINNFLRGLGADIKYSFYPTLGHSVWNQHWAEPGFIEFMQSGHKANPLVYFQRSEFCPDSAISAKIGIVPGYHTYEWEKDGQLIATSINGVNTVYDNNSVENFIGNEFTVKAFGTYRVRFKRTETGEFSVWSPRPAVIKSKPVTQTPDIQVSGIMSKVLPSLDGSTTTPLTLPNGYDVYEWYRSTDNVLVSTAQTFNAPVGSYKARVKEEFGCGALFSPVFKVINANGSPKPEPAKNLSAFALSQTSIQLDWNENPNAGSNEFGFEVYRAEKSGGPYQLIHITNPDITTFTDQNLPSGKKFFYVVRAVNQFGAAAKTNEASSETIADDKAPNAPSNLLYRGSNQYSVSLSWTPATDNVGVVRYDVYANDKKVISSKTSSATVFGLDSLTSYRFFVKAIDAAGNISQPSNQVTGYTHRQGLNYKYYNGSYSVLPNFNNLNPNKTGRTDTINNGSSFRTQSDNYAIYWEGFVYVPATGTYILETNSDDGSRLYVNTPYTQNNNGTTVINDSAHGARFRTRTVNLVQGYNSIVATYFEATGGDIMEVWWSSPTLGIPRERIPKNYFTFSNPGNPASPNAPSNLAANSGGYNKIILNWADNSSNEIGFEITRSSSLNGTYTPLATVSGNIVNYTDSLLSPSTQYFYKVRSVSSNSASSFTNAANATTSSAPAAPSIPTNLKANALGVDIIQLEFTDASSDEIGFEIWRSVGNANNFRKIATLDPSNGSTLSYMDKSLFANITYYYKVRSVGIVNSSNYTPTINAKTLNTKPSVEKILDFTMRFNTTFVLPVKAIDVDGDALTFTSEGLPTFATIKNISNGTINIEYKPRISDVGAYSTMVIVDDGNLGKDTTYFSMVVDDNSVPVMASIDNVELFEGDSLNIPVYANDPEGNEFLHWYYYNLPAFIDFQDNGDGNGLLKIKPGFSTSGEYSARIFVDDGFGAWTSQTFIINIIEKDPNQKVQVNFRYFTGGVEQWNDVALSQDPLTSPPAPRINVSNLQNVIGENSGIGLEVVSGTYTSGQSGPQTGNNSGVYPDRVLRDQFTWGFYANSNLSDTVVLKVKGLKQSHKYNLVFYSGNQCANCGTSTSTVRFKSGNQTAEIRYYLNTTKTDTLYSLSPDANGDILITMSGDASLTYGGMLNAMVIEAFYDDGTKPSKPVDLTANSVASMGVQLFWTDRSYNESNYKIYRSTKLEGPYSLVNTNKILKDSISYVDNTVKPYTEYFYYLIGENSYGEGFPSDTVSVITLNNKPVIAGLNNMFVKTDGVVEDEFEISDDPSEVLTVKLENKPSFVSLVSVSSNTYKIVANPTKDDIGWYNLTVRVKDDQGADTTGIITITVADKLTRSAYVKVGAAGLNAPAPWNNWLGGRTAGSQLLNLRDENGVITPWDIRSVTRWNGVSDLGMVTGNNSGVYPDSVLQSSITLTSTSPMQFSLLGLDTTKLYNITLLGSMNEGMDARMIASSGSEVDTLDARYNTTTTANLNGLIPNSAGTIDFYLTKVAASPVGYLSAIQIEEYDKNIALMNPGNLYAEPINRNSILLTWSDRSVNEDLNSGFEIQRSTKPDFSENLVSILVPRTTHSYINSSLPANTRYWYRVRAKSGSLTSEFSNKAKAVTPESIVSINFNYQVNNAPTPWNNLEVNPDVLDPYPGLIDQGGINTGMSIAIEKVFNGEFNAGKVTGNNSGVVPDNVLQANYWLDNTQISTMRVNGLNHSKRYRFGFIGSSSAPGWYKGNYTATYSIGNRTVYLNSWENSTKIVYIGNVAPDMNGEVLVTFSTTEKANYGFNAGMIIMAYDDDDTTALVDGARRIMQAPIVQQAQESREISQLDGAAKAYPNPFIEQINIDYFNSAASNNVTVDIIDMAGRLAYRKQVGQLPVGLNTIRLNTGSSLRNSGLYFVNLRVNGKVVKSSRMVKTNK